MDLYFAFVGVDDPFDKIETQTKALYVVDVPGRHAVELLEDVLEVLLFHRQLVLHCGEISLRKPWILF